ncbi:hydroxyethylthiazole kinase [Cetobacterium sp. 8H]|uniref:hydroxyethylthiazole kinase n=1 Tax=Cetobacterium sp. 8H TaxID=2759681 RepID=UPI00163C78D5|nr:hydroxyethylthiazole kinase [Cetobacterium sp. 8H]MBC2850134.1 hydroxyethylthiazole kinase [Cetobacterium sp. 8H]
MNRENNFHEIISSLEKVRKRVPLVYHLTNTVTINDCANITLAVGGSPLMSFCLEEMEEIIGFASSVVINIGTMEKSMVKMAVKVGEIANRLDKPIILDPVGAGATQARKNLLKDLLSKVKFSVIKGNMAEIKAILGLDSNTRGVDSLENEEDGVVLGEMVVKEFGAVAAITGKVDYIVDKDRHIKIENGSPIMSKVTGTGCMTTSLIASFLGVEVDRYISTVAGVLLMGISGEIASENFEGTGSLKVAIIDNISKMNEEMIIKKSKMIS